MLGKEMVKRELTRLDVEVENYSELFEIMAEIFVDLGYACDEYLERLHIREASFPTALPVEPYPIAIPHTGAKAILKPFIAPVRLKKAVKWNQMSDVEKTTDVRMAFFLGFKDPEEFVDLLQVLMFNFERTDWVRSLFESNSEDEFYQLASDMIWDVDERIDLCCK